MSWDCRALSGADLVPESRVRAARPRFLPAGRDQGVAWARIPWCWNSLGRVRLLLQRSLLRARRPCKPVRTRGRGALHPRPGGLQHRAAEPWSLLLLVHVGISTVSGTAGRALAWLTCPRRRRLAAFPRSPPPDLGVCPCTRGAVWLAFWRPCCHSWKPLVTATGAECRPWVGEQERERNVGSPSAEPCSGAAWPQVGGQERRGGTVFVRVSVCCRPLLPPFTGRAETSQGGRSQKQQVGGWARGHVGGSTGRRRAWGSEDSACSHKPAAGFPELRRAGTCRGGWGREWRRTGTCRAGPPLEPAAGGGAWKIRPLFQGAAPPLLQTPDLARMPSCVTFF